MNNLSECGMMVVNPQFNTETYLRNEHARTLVALGLTQRRLLKEGPDGIVYNVGDGAGLGEARDIGGGKLGGCLSLCLVLKTTMRTMKAW